MLTCYSIYIFGLFVFFPHHNVSAGTPCAWRLRSKLPHKTRTSKRECKNEKMPQLDNRSVQCTQQGKTKPKEIERHAPTLRRSPSGGSANPACQTDSAEFPRSGLSRPRVERRSGRRLPERMPRRSSSGEGYPLGSTGPVSWPTLHRTLAHDGQRAHCVRRR